MEGPYEIVFGRPKTITVTYENNDRRMDSVYSKRIRAGKRRTYFFDVRTTKGNDYYLTITESRKRFNDEGYDRHKVFLYKEDFNKFLKALTEAVDHVKTDLMPDFDFDSFSHENDDEDYGDHQPGASVDASFSRVEEPEKKPVAAPPSKKETDGNPPSDTLPHEDVDKW